MKYAATDRKYRLPEQLLKLISYTQTAIRSTLDSCHFRPFKAMLWQRELGKQLFRAIIIKCLVVSQLYSSSLSLLRRASSASGGGKPNDPVFTSPART
jgi:hypothetical protein